MKHTAAQQAQDVVSTDQNENEGFYRLLVEHSPHCILRIDLKGCLSWINPAGLRMLSSDPSDQVLGKHFMSLVSERDYARISSLLQRALQGESSEYTFEDVNGKHYQSSFVPVNDEDGQLVYLMGANQDISERIIALEALRLSEERLKLALSAAEMGVWSYDVARDSFYWSERTYPFYGQDPDTFLGTKAAFLGALHPEDVEQVERQVKLATQRVGRFDSRHRVQLDSGEIRWLESVGRSVADPSGAVVQLLGTVTDVTDKVLMERQLLETQKLESLGILAGGIAHDFNNLLVGIMGSVEMALIGCGPDAPIASDLGHALTSAERAAELCRQMLTYADRGRFVQEDLNLSAVVAEIGSLIHSSIPKNVSIAYDLCQDLPPVWGEATQLRQVLMNLIINAAESIGEGIGRVGVRVGVEVLGSSELRGLMPEEKRQSGAFVCIQIEDDGVGMQPELLAKIFEPFYTTKATGRGLGLAAVLGHVGSHGGGLEVQSEPGLGTTFRVLLPAAKRASIISTSGIVGIPKRSLAKRILLVDDESIVRRFATKALESVGHLVTTVRSGRLGLDAIEEDPSYDLVLLDYSMHGMNGLETLRELRRLRPLLPVILSSGFLKEDIISAFSRFGGVTFLHKPYHLNELMQTLQDALLPGQQAESVN